ncbi:MAG: hypothetical protein N3D77_16420, partial [Geminicoccaceae bacterium]|nr:hypothetical protein [Geminicoccaceae bacterium]
RGAQGAAGVEGVAEAPGRLGGGDSRRFDGGRIVERGRHAELLAAGGLYAALWRRQVQERRPLAVRPETVGPEIVGQPG